MVLEPAHLLPSPACNGTVVNALGLVRNHEVLADPDNLSESAANRACAERAVEAEQVFVALAECDPVKLQPLGKMLQTAFRGHFHRISATGECTLGRAPEPRQQVLIRMLRKLYPVDEKVQPLREIPALRAPQHVVNIHYFELLRAEKAAESLPLQLQHQLHLILTTVPAKIGKEIHWDCSLPRNLF